MQSHAGDADRRLLNSYCELVEQAMLGGEAGVPGQSKATTASYILNPSGVEGLGLSLPSLQGPLT